MDSIKKQVLKYFINTVLSKYFDFGSNSDGLGGFAAAPATTIPGPGLGPVPEPEPVPVPGLGPVPVPGLGPVPEPREFSIPGSTRQTNQTETKVEFDDKIVLKNLSFKETVFKNYSFRSNVEEIILFLPHFNLVLESSFNITLNNIEIDLFLNSQQEKEFFAASTGAGATETTAPADIPDLLSSSFQFAQDFVQTSLDDDYTSSDSAESDSFRGLSDLAGIVDSIIGKASITINGLCLNVFAPESLNPQSNPNQNNPNQDTPNPNQDNPSLDNLKSNQSNSKINQSNSKKRCVKVQIGLVKLKDHITNNFDIPAQLKSGDMDILSCTVKYLVVRGLALVYSYGTDPETGTDKDLQDKDKDKVLLQVPTLWIRVLQSASEESKQPDSKNHQHGPSGLSDLQLSMYAERGVSVVQLATLQHVLAVLGVAGDQRDSPEPPKRFLFDLKARMDELAVYVLPLTNTVAASASVYQALMDPNPNAVAALGGPHLRLVARDIRMTSLTRVECRGLRVDYACDNFEGDPFVAQQQSNPKSDQSKKEPLSKDFLSKDSFKNDEKKNLKYANVCWFAEKENKNIVIVEYESMVLRVTFDEVQVDLRATKAVHFQSLFGLGSSGKQQADSLESSKGQDGGDPSQFIMTVNDLCLLGNVTASSDAFEMSDKKTIGIKVQVSGLVLRSSGGQWAVECPLVKLGMFSILVEPRLVRWVAVVTQSVVSFGGALAETKSTRVAMDEEMMARAHETCREGLVVDTLSTNSWSDMDEDLQSASSPKHGDDQGVNTSKAKKRKQTSPPASATSLKNLKNLVHVQIKSADFTVSQEEIGDFEWILDTLSRWNQNAPPEPTDLSLAINLCLGKLNVIFKDSAISMHHVLGMDQVRIEVAMNSVCNSKNLMMMDIFCRKISLESQLEDPAIRQSKWIFIEKDYESKDAPIEMMHVILSQTDDVEMEMRAIKATVCFKNAIINLPDARTNIPLPEFLSSNDLPRQEEIDSPSTFTDFFVGFSDCLLTHQYQEIKAVLYSNSLQLTMNIISDSPTTGYLIQMTNSVFYVGLTRLEKSFSASEKPPNVHSKRLGERLEILVSFIELKVETCRDSRIALARYVQGVYSTLLSSKPDLDQSLGSESSKSKSIPKTPRSEEPLSGPTGIHADGVVDTFDSVDFEAFMQKEQHEQVSEFDLEMEAMAADDEGEWMMEFEAVLSKEDTFVDEITVYPALLDFKPDPEYISRLCEVTLLNGNGDKTEMPEIHFEVEEGNISWKMYPGFDYNTISPIWGSGGDFHSSSNEDDVGSRASSITDTDNNRGQCQVELHILKLCFLVQLFPQSTVKSKIVSLRVRDLEVFDWIPQSKFRKFFSYQMQGGGSDKPPRETDSDMVDVFLEGVRVAGREELRLKLCILPIQLHIDQDVITFLSSFFAHQEKVNLSAAGSLQHSGGCVPEKDNSFFQFCEISPMSFQVDYKPKQVDFASIKQGDLFHLLNFIHLDEAMIFLTGIRLAGVEGWNRLFNRALSIWLPYVKNTQIPQMASGIVGMKTIVNLGSGIADLVLLPIEQYQKDGRIIRGIHRGTRSFLKASAKESARIGSGLAKGVEKVLEQAETRNKKNVFTDQSTQPQTLPASMLKPLLKLTGSVAETLARLSGDLNGKFK